MTEHYAEEKSASSREPDATLRAMAKRMGTPVTLTLELTTKCQLSCEHCYNFDRAEKSASENVSTLDKSTILRVLDEAAKLNVFYLCFTGGEATMHPELPTFVTEAKKKTFHVTVKSHGAISEAKVQELIVRGMDRFVVSIYGTQPTHDAFTGVRVNFDKTWRSIEHCLLKY